MNGEYSFYTLVINDPANRKGLVNPAASAGDYCAGKYLNPLFIAFSDLAVDVNHITYFKVWYVFFQTFAFNSIEYLCLHLVFSGIIFCFLLTVYYCPAVAVADFFQ